VPVAQSAGYAVDHVFFATEEIEQLVFDLERRGLCFDPARTHAGQGTANRCTRFANGYLELLHARDRSELRSDLVHPLGLDERIRWRATGACPVGICFGAATAASAATPRGFPTWDYRPPYLLTGDALPIVTPARALSEPLLFLSTWPERSFSAPDGTTLRHLNRICLRRPAIAAPLSDGVQWFVDRGLIEVELGPEHGLRLEASDGLKIELPMPAP
jgi:hypothetical protein